MDRLHQDLKLAFRALVRDRGFAVAMVATLALCVAANAAIFAVANAVLLRSLPFPAPERLVTIFNAYPGLGVIRSHNGEPDYFDRLHETNAFEALALYRTTGVAIGGRGQGEGEYASSMVVTPSFFRVLRVQPLRGQFFGETEIEVGQHRKVILSYSLWQRLYSGRDDAVGQNLRINGEPHIVTGVMPPGFRFVQSDVQLWMPAAFSAQDRSDNRRHSNNWQMIGRLMPSATLAQAQSQIDALNARNLDRFPQLREVLTKARFHTSVSGLQEDLVREARPTILLLWGGALLVLIIGCVNVANLASVRATARSRELATRLALGTTTGRLMQQTITESMLFSVLGGILGVLLTLWALRGIEYLGLDALPRGGEIALDWAAVVYSFLLVSIVGVIIGLWPTLSMRWSSLAQVIRAEGRSGMQSRGTRTTQRILVTAQVALALVMLIGAGLLLASFERVLAVDLGFRPEPVLTGSINLPNSRYPGRPEMLAVADRVLTQLKALPGVTAVGLTTSIPLGGTYSDAVIVPEGYQSSTGESLISPSQVIVSEGYFEAIGATLLAGRFIDARDSEMAPRAIVIDDALARKFWPNADPIGRRMYYPSSVDLAPPPEKEWLTVVGVVKGIRLQAIDDRALTGLFGAYFLPYRQFPSRTMTLAVKTSRDAANATRTVRDVITRVDSELVFYDVQTMERIVDRALVGRRTPMILAVAFAAVALALAAIGIYGVISYSVTQRSREIGLRLALGAQPTDVLRRVIGEGMRLVIVGLVLGLLASFSLAQLVSNLLYEVTPTDPTTVAGACVLALLISFIASFIPARRAARVDPLVALRYE